MLSAAKDRQQDGARCAPVRFFAQPRMTSSRPRESPPAIAIAVVVGSGALCLREQLFHRLAAIDDLDGPADTAHVLFLGVDLESGAESLEEAGHLDRTVADAVS